MLERIIIFVASALIVGLAKLITTSLTIHKLGYRELIVSKKGRESELISGFICLVLWLAFFIFDLKSQTIQMLDPKIYSLLLGCMEGICISSIYTILFMPRGLYEKGIVSETRVALYSELAHHKISNTVNKKYTRFTFNLMDSNKKKSINLFVHNDQIQEVENLLKKHKK